MVDFTRLLRRALSTVMIGIVAAGCAANRGNGTFADTVYTNGKIYTVNEAQPWAEAVAIKDGEFIIVGSNADVEKMTSDNTKVVGLGGKFVMPGIVDMHAHPFTGVELGTGAISLTEPTSPDAMVAAVKEYVEANPGKRTALGGNWNVGGVFENDSPDKKLLDEVAPNAAVFLLSQSGHSGWANSKALELAGIDENYQNSGNYIFDRYPGTNEPSGTVRESAMVLIVSTLGYMSAEDFEPFLPAEIDRYSRFGVTAIQSAEGSASWLRAAASLEEEGRLNVRFFPALDWLTSQLRATNDDDTKAFIDDWKSYETELIKPHYVKIFGDGAADSHTQWMKEPFADAPDDYGSMYLPIDQYREAILYYHSKGMTPHVHALGDRTAAEIISIFEDAEAANPDSPAVLHLGHAQLVDDEDLDRLAALKKVTVDFSPMLAVPAPPMKMFLTDPLGDERHQQIYPVRKALDRGIVAGFGSDFPSSLVPEPNQFWYMEGWVTRQFPGQPGLGSINKSQAITVEEAIRGFTLGGAEALGYGYSKVFGSIESGKSADFIVLDRNLLEIPATEIHETEVQTTIFRGRVVFDGEVAEAAP